MDGFQVSNSSDSKLSDDQIDVVSLVYRLICSTFVFVVGVPGNSLIVCVYRSKAIKTSTHMLIMSLAYTDLLTCLFQFTDVLSDSISLVSGQNYESTFVDMSALFELTTVVTSICITIVISLDRYDCICRPQRRFFNATRANAATFIAFLVALGISGPYYIVVLSSYSIPGLEEVSDGFQLFILLFSLMVIIISYSKVYMAIRKHVKVGLTSKNMATPSVNLPKVDQQQQNPVTKAPLKPESALLTIPTNKSGNMSLQMISVASTSTSETNETAASESSNENHAHPITLQTGTSGSGSEVQDQAHHHGGRREKTTGSPSLQRKTTRMLLITNVVLMLTWTPYCIYVIFLFVSRGGLSVDPLFLEILDEVFIVVHINNFGNPIIYGLANRRFRQDCVALLRKIHIC